MSIHSRPTRKVDVGESVGLYIHGCGSDMPSVKFWERISSLMISSIGDFEIVDV